MNNFLLYVGGFLVMVLAALFAGPHFIDWNGYRGIFEEEAARMLGRDVRVGGSVNVRLLPSPYVRFEKLRIADTEGTSGEPLFRADDFTMWLSVPPLLRGVLEANEVELSKPVLRLATNQAGEGNWRTLSVQRGTLPFVPADVTLNSVKIIDGSISFHAPNGGELVNLEHVNGEFSADALAGPFKFKGAAAWRGEGREVRFTTGDLGIDGSMPLKAQFKTVSSGNTYSLDGAIADLKGKPRIEGEVTARVPLSKVRREADAKATDPSAEKTIASPSELTPELEASLPAAVTASAGSPELDFKSKISGDTTGLILSDIAISVENAGAPQMLTGAAKIAWNDVIESDVSLTSRWLDADKLTGSGPGNGPLSTLEAVIDALADVVPREGKGLVAMTIDQVQFGGDSVSPLKIVLARSGTDLVLRNLGAGLPGSTRADISGMLVPGDKGLGFKGRVALSGTILQRFTAWAGQQAASSGPLSGIKADGDFSLNGDLEVSLEQLALTEAMAKIGGVPLSGGLKVSRGERKAIVLSLAGPRVDLDALGLSDIGLADWPRLAFGQRASVAVPTADGAADGGMSNVRLNLNAGELITRGIVLNGFNGEIAKEDGRLTLSNVNFAAKDGLRLTFDGDIAGLGVAPQGVLRYTLEAETAKAAVAMADWLGDQPAAEGPQSFERQAQELVPLRVAGSVHFGDGSDKKAVVVRADGLARNGRIVAQAHFANGLKEWRQSPVDVFLSLDNSNPSGLMTSLVGTKQRETVSDAKPGRLVVKAVGILEKGALANVSVEGQTLALGFNGRVTAADGKDTNVVGDLRIAVADARDAIELTGLKPPAVMNSIPLSSIVRVTKSGPQLNLAFTQTDLGKSTLAGQLALTSTDDGRRTMMGDVTVSEAQMVTLLGILLAPRPTGSMEPRVGGPVTVAGRQKRLAAKEEPPAVLSVWPEETFDFSSTDGLTGELRVSVSRLELQAGLVARDLATKIVFKEQAIEAVVLDAKVLGGKLTGALALAKTAGGVDLNASFAVKDANLAVLQPSELATVQSSGSAAAMIEISGRAQSPAALMTVLKGQGEIALSEGKLAGPSAHGLTATVEQVVIGKVDAQGERFITALVQNTAGGEAAFPAQKLAVQISEGAARVAPVIADSPEGKSSVTATVDLQTMSYYADWRLQSNALSGPTAAGVARPPLPDVSVLYSGPLQSLGQAQPKFSTAALERELAVRKLEQAVDELERLRTLDEERAIRERERQKVIEAEKARLIETAPDQPANPGVPQPTTPNSAQPAAGSAVPVPQPGVVAVTPGTPTLPGTPDAAPVLPKAAPIPGVPVPPPIGAVTLEPEGATPSATTPGQIAPPQAAAAPPSPPSSPAPRPTTRPKPRQSPGDDILRSLGGVP